MRVLLAIVTWLLTTVCGFAYKAEVEGWAVQYIAVNDPDFSGCVMGRSYEGGTRLSMMVSTQYKWAIGVANQAWHMQKGVATDIAVLVDGKFVASGKATTLDDKSALLPLSGSESYRAVQMGRRLDLQTPHGNLNFALVGTAKAMDAVLECVRIVNATQQRVPEARAPEGLQFVPQAEALVMVTNLLNSAGIVGYRLETPNQGSTWVNFTLADGTYGAFTAAHGSTDADDHAAGLIGKLSELCKGQFISGKQPVPSTDGSVVRKVVTTCRTDGRSAVVTETTVIRKPSGFLINVSLRIRASAVEANAGGSDRDRAAVVDAALRMPGR